ncbi:YfgM family protein [Bathymodiolus septemdierum thioautotrophic gill symbiont]|uniref:Ancillary SecYEG translocon subunit n=1 Tax=endosymbiont of Bathymodiolus septemdierum str. Myojin knoll TaxID=1303921 RepID=A0A0N7KBA9_9GAMM|nr:tetratricopeptide repeat protein [Bathymodiolus septemdierum thioautotrophic gill symbiont]BAS67503.1 conserved hypothetical protein [endosymbiont of Bathymodiolus septemdierum str. Myojin knoll]
MKNFIEVSKTEEEQAEQIKKWLKENLPHIIIGVALGLGGIWGFNYYETEQYKKALESRANYLSVVANPDNTKALSALKASGTYTQEAELLLAKQAVTKGDYQSAIAHLLPLTESENKFLKHIAKMRAASVYLEMNKTDEALAILGNNIDLIFGAMYDNIKGDIYFSKNDITNAKKHYQAALTQLPTGSALINLITIKLKDLN